MKNGQLPKMNVVTPQWSFLAVENEEWKLFAPPHDPIAGDDDMGDDCGEWGTWMENDRIAGIKIYCLSDSMREFSLSGIKNAKWENSEIKISLVLPNLFPVEGMPLMPVYRGLYRRQEIFQLSGYDDPIENTDRIDGRG